MGFKFNWRQHGLIWDVFTCVSHAEARLSYRLDVRLSHAGIVPSPWSQDGQGTMGKNFWKKWVLTEDNMVWYETFFTVMTQDTTVTSKKLKTRRMAITNWTCVSFCNQPKEHFGLPWVRPTIAVNVTCMKRGFNACQTPPSMYQSIFNHFPVIQPVNSKVRHFSTFFLHFWPPWVRLWDNHLIAVNVTWMEEDSILVKRIAA